MKRTDEKANGTRRMLHTDKPTEHIRPRLGNLVMVMTLALTLCVAPLAAFAADEPATNAAASKDAPDSAGAVKHGLHAESSQTAHSNETDVSTTDNGACGLFAEAGAVIVANALNVQTTGNLAPAVGTSANGGSVSIANSQLATSGTESPLFSDVGTIEADNVQGSSTKSPIAAVLEEGSLIVANSALESAYSGSGITSSSKGAVPTSAIALYRTAAIDTTASKIGTALFQASGSTLTSSIESGSFFYLTNTQASIVLFGNDLDFDADKAKLLKAVGSDATSGLSVKDDTATFGTAGKNGAMVTFTALDQKLEGDIEADSISSVGLFLLEGSKWTGSCDITPNPAGTDVANNIAVNIDASSGWIVTGNSTVSSLNIEKGGMLVDEEGKAVTIVDADGNKLVDGASDVEVAVVEAFSTTVKTTDANKLQDSAIDRTAFDEEFGTSTAFGTNGSSTSLSDEERTAELKAIIVSWFRNL